MDKLSTPYSFVSNVTIYLCRGEIAIEDMTSIH